MILFEQALGDSGKQKLPFNICIQNHKTKKWKA